MNQIEFRNIICEFCHKENYVKVIKEIGSDKMQWNCPYCGYQNRVRTS